MSKTPVGRKLFNLKEWLTLDDTAKHLSISFGEEVTRADVLRLALDGRLKLSVDFVNHANARKGRLVPFSECLVRIMPNPTQPLPSRFSGPFSIMHGVKQEDVAKLDKEIQDALERKELMMVLEGEEFRKGKSYEDSEWLVLEKETTSISGIWDLTMVGAESLDVEHLYQAETGGPAITLVNLGGPLVERDGVVCELQEDFEDNEFQRGSKAHGEKIESEIASGTVPPEEAERLRKEYAEQRKLYLDDRKSRPKDRRYYPAHGLPSDGVYVVRTAAIRDFERAVLEGNEQKEKPLGKREESSLLNIIGGLLGLLGGKTPAGKRQSVFDSQASVIAALLASYEGKPGISQRTLEEKFAAAKRSLES